MSVNGMIGKLLLISVAIILFGLISFHAIIPIAQETKPVNYCISPVIPSPDGWVSNPYYQNLEGCS